MNHLLKRNFTPYFSAALDILYPRCCIVCGQALNLQERYICLSCSSDFPYTHFETDSHNRMARYYNERLCERFPDSYFPYQYAISLLRYRSDDPYAQIPWALKFKRNIAAGEYFTHLLAQKIREAPYLQGIDLIIPVPQHPLRRWQRGYNQAEVIARTLAEDLCIPLETKLLTKSRYTRSQVGIDTARRNANVSSSFALSERRRYVLEDCRHILLVDDVFTTGATLSECHKTIRADSLDETVRISVATLACAEN